jgi:hypothetical protein
MVLLRLQVLSRCQGQPHSLVSVLGRTREMEGGALRVLFRGNGVSMVAGVPSAAVGWQVYESVRVLLENVTGGPSLSTSFLGGCVSGCVTSIVMRPFSVTVVTPLSHNYENMVTPLQHHCDTIVIPL